ncbi:tRNA pseudouridine(38-40) synthase TruA [Oceanobacillus sp. CAU 1775]
MVRVKCTLEYDGSGFSGFQFQPEGRTIGGELEKVLKKMHKGEFIRIQSAGRTDAGVHAKGQVVHFDTPLTIPDENWKRALNTLLPDDIYIVACENVTDAFHARYSAIAKEYHYEVITSLEPDIFRRYYASHVPYELDLEEMKAACQKLVGTHDFTTFSSAKATVKGSRVRELYALEIEETNDGVRFIFKGNGFLYNMVRIIVSVLIDVGRGKRKATDIPGLIAAKNRQLIGKTMPPEGLYLWEVVY